MTPLRPFLRAWRKAKGLTLEHVANEMGTAHTTVSRWEKQEYGVDDATFARIAELYGITPAELAGDPADAERARELHRLFTTIPDLDQGSLRALADMADRLPKLKQG